MALKQNAETSGKNFEAPDDENGGEGVAATGRAPTADERIAAQLAKEKASAPAPEQAAAQTTAVAEKATGGAVVNSIAKANPYLALKNAIRVDYNTLPALMATNGNIQHKKTKKLMGDTIGLELISIQDHWVMSPGGESNDEESLKYLKYSDDGITTRDGESMAEAVKAAKNAGYDKAAIKKRLILVGAIFDGGKLPELVGEVVQVDCAPNTANNFNQHQISTAYKIGKNLVAADRALMLKLTADVKDERKMQWTEIVFSIWPAA